MDDPNATQPSDELGIDNREKFPPIQKISDRDNVVLLAFINSYIPREDEQYRFKLAEIDLVDEFNIEATLEQIKEQTSIRKAYLLVNSFGGNLGASFKIAKAIRNAFDDITVFVPHIAASGGTLIAVAGNSIRMGVMSQLGPCDPQIPYKGRRVSVNSMFSAKAKLDEQLTGKTENELTYMDKHLTHQLDPVIIQEFEGIQEESKAYLKAILLKSMKDKSGIDKIVDHLMLSFPSHSFVIGTELAKEIGLNVEDGNDDVHLWRTMRLWLAQYIDKVTDRHFVRYCVPNNANN